MRALVLAAAAVLLLAGPVLAQPPMATAPLSGPLAPDNLPPPVPLPAEDGFTSADGQPMAMGPCGPEKVKADGTLETKPHGEVDVGVGASGYRHVAGAVCQPIGQNGAVAVSISNTQIDASHRHH
jgi:hypothetical protein